MQIKDIIFVGGFARSGKTTTLKRLKRLGYTILSTSQYLDLVCEKDLESCWKGKLAKKTIADEKLFYDLTGKTMREYKIDKAENQIVPNLGRYEGIIKPTLQPLLTSSSSKFAIETIGGEEFLLMQRFLQENITGYKCRRLNCRSLIELKGVDSRELLPPPMTSYWSFFDCPLLTSIV